LFAQLFLRLLNNGENGVLGIEAVCFQPKQLVSDCSTIVPIVQELEGIPWIDEVRLIARKRNLSETGLTTTKDLRWAYLKLAYKSQLLQDLSCDYWFFDT